MTARMAPADTIDDDVQAATDVVMRGNPVPAS